MKIVWIVTWSLFSQTGHSLNNKIFETEEDCKKFYNEEYESAIEMIKKHKDVKVFSFWEDVIKDKKPWPDSQKEGPFLFVWNMFENEKSISYQEDGKTLVSYKIAYFNQPLITEK